MKVPGDALGTSPARSTPSPHGRGSPRSALRRERSLAQPSAQRRGEGLSGTLLPNCDRRPFFTDDDPSPRLLRAGCLVTTYPTQVCALRSRPSPVGRGWPTHVPAVTCTSTARGTPSPHGRGSPRSALRRERSVTQLSAQRRGEG